jgi:carbamoyl-phosphate synthase small subunit
MKGIISTLELDKEKLVDKAKYSQGLVGIDLAKEVTCKSPFLWNKFKEKAKQDEWNLDTSKKKRKLFIIAMDFGIKYNILRRLESFGCQIKVVPANTEAQDILKLNPDGILLSNGPGDPKAVTYAVRSVKHLIGKKPIFGICLGHQIMGLVVL